MEKTATIAIARENPEAPDRGAVALMAGAAGLAVASIYYSQPMLGILAKEFHADPASISWIATLTQAGYAVGLVTISPLGDRFERRWLIGLTFGALAMSLAMAALSTGFGMMLAASFLVGAFASVAQQVVPMAAQLASDERRGRVVGSVMAGLLAGILLSRTVSGFAAEYGGWRGMFAGAAVASVLMGAASVTRLPRAEPVTAMSYAGILASLGRLLAVHGKLRRAGIVQGMIFAGFVAFWANLALYLERPPFSQGSAVAGLLGVVGLAGVATAPVAGRLADRGGASRQIALGAGLFSAGFVIMGAFPESWTALIGAIVLMDVGMQLAMVANQARIYALDASARSRLNTVLVTMMFVFGAAGSAAGALVFARYGWSGVCAVGAGLGGGAFAIEAFLPDARRG